MSVFLNLGTLDWGTLGLFPGNLWMLLCVFGLYAQFFYKRT